MPQQIFFGNAESHLFGIYHPPTGKPRQKAVVLCNPIGQEYVRSYRCYRQLAGRLSSNGVHVFRFDYFGTGDSAGSLDEGSIPVWLENIAQAIEELQAMSAVKRVSLMGLRFGATLAALLAHERKDIDSLLLWDPVTDGKDYLGRLRDVHADMLVDPDRFPYPRTEQETSSEELLGFAMPEHLESAIRAARLTTVDDAKLRQFFVVDTQNNESLMKLGHTDTGTESKLEYIAAEADLYWNDATRIEIALMPNDVIDAISSRLSK